MIAFVQYKYCVFFGVKFPIYPTNWVFLRVRRFFLWVSILPLLKTIAPASQSPKWVSSYIVSLSENSKPHPVYHFFPKITLSFSCFLLRIPYTLPRKSNKNLKSDFYLSSPFWWTDKPSMNIWRKYLTARSQPTSISLKNSEFIQG